MINGGDINMEDRPYGTRQNSVCSFATISSSLWDEHLVNDRDSKYLFRPGWMSIWL